MNLALYQPEIPPNTGNIIRLAANTGCQLHLIGPLGFTLDHKRLRRAGLDYAEWRNLRVYDGWWEFLQTAAPTRLFALSTKGGRHYHRARFRPEDYLLLGPETRGLPNDILGTLAGEQILRIPMRSGSRSMNLSNAAAVVVYEALRQLGFPDFR